MELIMERLARRTRLTELGSLSVPGLITAGYLCLIGSAFWMFTRRVESTLPSIGSSIEQNSPSSTERVVCHCEQIDPFLVGGSEAVTRTK